MDAAAVILLMVEAVMALLLLYFDGLLKKPAQVLTCAGRVAAAFVLRALSKEDLALIPGGRRVARLMDKLGGKKA